MKIAIVHNAYGRPSGEEVVIDNLVRNLEAHGHIVPRFERCSAEIDRMRLGQARAFLSGIYNPASRRAFGRFLSEQRPDVVHIHNVFPLISPAILPEARRRNIPVVMTLHNFRLICPNGLLMRDGKICHECLGGREYRCVLRNCERNLSKSLGYALRTGVARRRRWFLDNVNHFICLSRFQREMHLKEGFSSERCSVIPNAVPTEFLSQDSEANRGSGGFVGYVGRLSPEKDIPTLLEAARKLPQVPFKVAGSLARMPELPKQAPTNVEFVGQLDRPALKKFYGQMRVYVFTTRWYEGLPTVLLEAMMAGLPIVCTRIGGLPDLVHDGETGLLAPLGDPAELASRIQTLWETEDLAKKLGEAGRVRVLREYHPEVIYARHMQVYEKISDL